MAARTLVARAVAFAVAPMVSLAGSQISSVALPRTRTICIDFHLLELAATIGFGEEGDAGCGTASLASLCLAFALVRPAAREGEETTLCEMRQSPETLSDFRS
jgi:RIO kinase 2